MQTLDVPKTFSVRDFAYEIDHPLHYGVNYAQLHTSAGVSHTGDHIPWAQNESRDDQEVDEDNDIREDEQFDESPDSIHGKAIALFDFVPENDNEFELKEGQIIWINYRHGQGWLVAAGYTESKNEDGTVGTIVNEFSGLVPEEYVQLLDQ